MRMIFLTLGFNAGVVKKADPSLRRHWGCEKGLEKPFSLFAVAAGGKGVGGLFLGRVPEGYGIV